MEEKNEGCGFEENVNNPLFEYFGIIKLKPHGSIIIFLWETSHEVHEVMTKSNIPLEWHIFLKLLFILMVIFFFIFKKKIVYKNNTLC